MVFFYCDQEFEQDGLFGAIKNNKNADKNNKNQFENKRLHIKPFLDWAQLE